MILINKNSSNIIFATATEKASLVSPYFLWELVSETSKTSTVFLCANTTSFPARYDLFNVIETGLTSVNLSAGTIHLDATGFYNYKIYEQSSSTNLNLNNTVSLLEQGVCYVSGTSSINYTYGSASTSLNYIVYKS